MEECGIGGAVNKWLKNYLLNRIFLFHFDGNVNEEMLAITGVATGSISGPVTRCYARQVNSLSNVICLRMTLMIALTELHLKLRIFT